MDILIKLARFLVYNNLAVYSIIWTIIFFSIFLSVLYLLAHFKDIETARVYLVKNLTKAFWWFLSSYFMILTCFILLINVAEFKSLLYVRMRDLLFGTWNSICFASAYYTFIRLMIDFVRHNYSFIIIKKDRSPDYVEIGLRLSQGGASDRDKEEIERFSSRIEHDFPLAADDIKKHLNN